MNEYFAKIMVVLFVLFVLSMIRVIFTLRCRRKRWNERQNMIVEDGFMKLFIQIMNGKGLIQVETVDGETPIYSSEVIQRAIFLSPGEHIIRLSVKAKEQNVADRFLPYYKEMGTFEVSVFAKRNSVASLFFDAETQHMFIKESEEKTNGTI